MMMMMRIMPLCLQPAPSETLNGALTGHDVAYRDVSADDWSTLTVDSPADAVTVGNLSLFVTYEFKVRSVNSVGVSVYSQPLTHYTELGLFTSLRYYYYYYYYR